MADTFTPMLGYLNMPERCNYYGHPVTGGNWTDHECPPVELVNCRIHGVSETDIDMGICADCTDGYYNPEF